MKTILKIQIKEMKLSEDKGMVEITGETVSSDCYGKKVKGKLSILQLAKIWSTDRKIANEIENDFGSRELEDKCEETRELIEKFPNISVWDKEIEFSCVSIDKGNWVTKNQDPKIKRIYAEDIVGWDNEGFYLEMPMESYEYLFKGKEGDLLFFMTPFTIKLIARTIERK